MAMSSHIQATRGQAARTAIGCSILFVLLLYGWALRGSVTALTSRSAPGYYGLLTEALVSGQLSLKVEPHPGLAKLKNPWAGAQDVPRLHDASYYHGKYYLYFGAAPVVLLFGPWRLLTGTYLTDGTGTVIFAAIGFLLCTRLWWQSTRRCFPELSSGWIALGVIVIGLGNYVFFLLQTPVFYHVPITCAFMCIMLAANALLAASQAKSGHRAALALGLAGLFWAACIGSRPNYLFSLPLLLPSAWLLSRRFDDTVGFGPIRIKRGLFWTVVPVAVVGFTIAWYNFMRFGNITEFGVTYQFAATDQRFIKLMNFANVTGTLKAYLTAGANYSPYFPFVLQKTDVIGSLIWAPFACLAVFFPLAVLHLIKSNQRAWAVVLCTIAAVVPLHLLSLCLLPFANDRYVVDFLPEATLIALVTVCVPLSASRNFFILRAATRALVLAFLLTTLAQSTLLGLQRHSNKATQHAMAMIGDRLSPLWEKIVGIHHGPVELKLRFPNSPPGTREPLIATGADRDIVYVEYLANSRIRFEFFHEGTGGPVSDPLAIDATKNYTVRIELGSLYPPNEHPLFRTENPSYVDALRRHMAIRLNEAKVLEWTTSFYESNPLEQKIGKLEGSDIMGHRFAGQIIAVSYPGIPSRAEMEPLRGEGPIRLTLRFPRFANVTSESLLSTGRPGAGDLIYVTYLNANRIRFGHDSWGAGAITSVETNYDPTTEHILDIDMGCLYPGATGLPDSTHLLQLRFDGRILAALKRPFNPTEAADISVGYNATQSSAASPFYTGPELRAQRIPKFEFEESNLIGWGPVRMSVTLPAAVPGTQEPILVTGSTGAGDFIYVRCEDETHIRIGLDHWGNATIVSEPITVDRAKSLSVIVSLTSMYPDVGDDRWNSVPRAEQEEKTSQTMVYLNEQIALKVPVKAFAADPHQMVVGENRIGGSNCASRFSGIVNLAERLGVNFPLAQK